MLASFLFGFSPTPLTNSPFVTSLQRYLHSPASSLLFPTRALVIPVSSGGKPQLHWVFTFPSVTVCLGKTYVFEELQQPHRTQDTVERGKGLSTASLLSGWHWRPRSGGSRSSKNLFQELKLREPCFLWAGANRYTTLTPAKAGSQKKRWSCPVRMRSIRHSGP